MKSLLLTLTMAGMAVAATAASPKNSHYVITKSVQKMDKTLIVYYSWSGNTQKLAQQIQALTGADIFEITPALAYPSDYDACVKQAKQEINAKKQPELARMPANLADYEVIFVGSPNWWSTIAPPVATFLAKAPLRGKSIIPFCTHGGDGEANLFADIAKLVPQSKVLKGLSIEGSVVGTSYKDVEAWVNGLDIFTLN
jgi:flavodoxin